MSRDKEIKPSDLAGISPWNPAVDSHKSMIVAMYIIEILERTGNKFRKLGWDEYKAERLKDSKNLYHAESQCFEEIARYCKSYDTAKLFTEEWNLDNIEDSLFKVYVTNYDDKNTTKLQAIIRVDNEDVTLLQLVLKACNVRSAK